MYRLLTSVLLLGGTLFVCVSCGSDSPSGPSTTTVSTQSITVTLSTPLVVGGTAQATATATMSNGTTQAITNGFKSDTAGVATVTDAGMVTAVSAGAANVYVVSGGQQGTRGIRVVPSYAGNWSGSYYVTGCSQTGDYAAVDLCQNFTVNRVMPYNLALTQAGETVNGTSYLGSIGFPAPVATIGAGGDLPLYGTYTEDTGTITVAWALSCATPNRITGTLQHVWRDTDASGQMVVTATIRDSMKLATHGPAADTEMARIVQAWRQRVRR